MTSEAPSPPPPCFPAPRRKKGAPPGNTKCREFITLRVKNTKNTTRTIGARIFFWIQRGRSRCGGRDRRLMDGIDGVCRKFSFQTIEGVKLMGPWIHGFMDPLIDWCWSHYMEEGGYENSCQCLGVYLVHYYLVVEKLNFQTELELIIGYVWFCF